MKALILVLNAGSSSDKCMLFKTNDNKEPIELWEGMLDWSKINGAVALKVSNLNGKKLEKTFNPKSRSAALQELIETAWKGDAAVIQEGQNIECVGHRIVHGANRFHEPVLITQEVKDVIQKFAPLAPLHNPAELEGINILEKLYPNIPHIAVFDTAFHTSIPEKAKIYPLPYKWYEEGIMRFGFHGISHAYCMQRTAKILSADVNSLNMITCHLGNGSSLASIKCGKSVDTTMGFTPMEGLMMGTRSGSIDPGILLYKLKEQGLNANDLDHILNFESGLKGISEFSDFRQILERIKDGNIRSELALDIFIHRLKSCLLSMLASLEKLDAIVFTAGIGENSAIVRSKTCEGLEFLNVKIANELNENCKPDQVISSKDSNVKVVVIHTREEFAIAQSSLKFLKQ